MSKYKCKLDDCKNRCTSNNCKDRMADYDDGVTYIDGYGLCEDLEHGFLSASGEVVYIDGN